MSTSVLAWRAHTKYVGLARHFLVLGQRLFVWIVRPSRTRSSTGTQAPNIAAALHWQEFCEINGANRMKDTVFEMDPRIPYDCFFAFADEGACVARVSPTGHRAHLTATEYCNVLFVYRTGTE